MAESSAFPKPAVKLQSGLSITSSGENSHDGDREITGSTASIANSGPDVVPTAGTTDSGAESNGSRSPSLGHSSMAIVAATHTTAAATTQS